jgi:hypothetical protein
MVWATPEPEPQSRLRETSICVSFVLREIDAVRGAKPLDIFFYYGRGEQEAKIRGVTG